ncbi:hypothetical protein K438DRAFT_1967697 [Mycena galopus ATCC 62051]|nr:hypothetical protein K438DRAFT_1967697 [Mycena galopus ATCC 62051]
MTFLPGTQLAKLWFDPAWFTDQRRNTVFQSLASFLSQLSSHEFSSIGQLDIDPTHAHFVGHFIRPQTPSVKAKRRQSSALSCGPYQSMHIYLNSMIKLKLDAATSMTDISNLQLLRTFAGMLPHPTFDGAPFFLSHPGCNYQNILVDAAFARYSLWITREASKSGEDLSCKAQQEDFPATLSRFRDEYIAVLNRLNPDHGQLTRYSHLEEALEIAIQLSLVYTRCADILYKFTE